MYDDKVSKGGYEIICQGSNDGKNWTEIGKLSGSRSARSAVSGRVVVTDPNKQTGETTMPVRKLNETITFNSENAYSDYRVLLKMAGAHDWVFTEANFMDKDGGLVEMKPSQFFNSAWMSATGGEEWLYVDLGSMSEFDKVVLHWINKADQRKSAGVG